MQTKASQQKRKLVAKTSLALVTDDAPALTVQPRFVTDANSEAVTGLKFRRWCEHFPALVRFVGRKRVIVADELQRAVSAHGAVPTTTVDSAEPVDPAEAVRSILRRAGGQ